MTLAPHSVRLLCVDDNTMVAEALVRRLRYEPMVSWIDFVTESSLILDQVMSVSPDVVLMDIDIPSVDTFSIVAALASRMPNVRVIMLSGHVIPTFIDRALDAGAWGYVSKNEDISQLIDAIKRVTQDEIALSPEVRRVHEAALNNDR